MARRALSAARAVGIVNFLTGHPGDAFTLSELARELDVDVASMHAVLAILSAEGYVVRDPVRKTYRLGPSLIAVGQAALDQHPAIQRARDGAAELARRLGLECIAGVVAGSELLTVGEAGRPDRLLFRPRVGQRLPFMPPLGILAAAFLPDSQREAWLARMGPGHRDGDRDAYRRACLVVRRQGYEIGLETATRDGIGLLLHELSQDPGAAGLQARLAELVAALGHEGHQLVEPEPETLYRVNNMQAPIFGTRGELVAGLTLLGFEPSLPGREVSMYVEILVTATRTITRASGGRPPLD